MPPLFARGDSEEDQDGGEEEEGADYGGGDDATLDHCEEWIRGRLLVYLREREGW